MEEERVVLSQVSLTLSFHQSVIVTAVKTVKANMNCLKKKKKVFMKI